MFVLGAAVRDVEDGQDDTVELERDVAAFRDLDGVRPGLFVGGQGLGHLLGGLEIELIRGELHAIGLGERPAGLDADEHVLRVGVRRLDVVDVVRGDERYAELPAELRNLFVEVRLAHTVVGNDALILHLEVEVALAEDGLVELRPALRFIGHPALERLADDSAHACRGGDESRTERAQQLFVDARFVVEACGLCLGDHRHEVAVADLVLSEEQQVIERGLALAREARVGGEVDLAAEDGPHGRTGGTRVLVVLGCVARCGSLVELDRPEHDAMIGERDRVHTERVRAIEQSPDLGVAVEYRILGVRVQVDEGHVYPSVSAPATRSSGHNRPITVRYPSAP